VHTDFTIGKCTRKCAVSGQPLAPGEHFYSVVVGEGDAVVRKDISTAAWTGPPPQTVGWWRVKMPDAAAKKLQPAPVGVLLDTLSKLLEQPGDDALAYMLALLLCRRRVLIDEESPDADASEITTDSIWRLTYPPDGRQWSVPVAVPASHLLEELQTQLNALIFTEV
jgi:hypothetical protein